MFAACEASFGPLHVEEARYNLAQAYRCKFHCFQVFKHCMSYQYKLNCSCSKCSVYKFQHDLPNALNCSDVWFANIC